MTQVCVLLVYWVWKLDSEVTVQMQKWNGEVIDINATVSSLGTKCKNILGVHALSGCDTVSYPFGKGKVSALKVLDMDILHNMERLGEEDATLEELLAAATQFFLILYDQKDASNLNQARYNIYKKIENKA